MLKLYNKSLASEQTEATSTYLPSRDKLVNFNKLSQDIFNEITKETESEDAALKADIKDIFAFKKDSFNFGIDLKEKNLSQEEIHKLFEAQKLYWAKQNLLVSALYSNIDDQAVLKYNNSAAYNLTSEQASNSSNRKAYIQEENLSPMYFTPVGLKDSVGIFSVGMDESWCYTGLFYKLKFSSPYKYDIVCFWFPNNYIGAEILFSSNNIFFEGINSIIYDNIIIRNGDGPVLNSEPKNVWNHIFFGDFDGDGLDEIGISYVSGFRIYKHDKKEWMWVSRIGSQKENWCARAVDSILIEGIRVGDFNGDGRDDLWCHNKITGDNKILFSKFTNTNIENLNTGLSDNWIKPSFSLENKVWCQGGTVRTGDFDGDGKSDVICTKTDNWLNEIYHGLSILFSLGDGSFVSKSGYGDGYIPLLAPGGNTPTDDRKLWYWWDKISKVENLLPGYSSYYTESTFIADFDGDGRDDLYNFWSDGTLVKNKFLFSSRDEFFVSRFNLDSNGLYNVANRDKWCPRYTSTRLVADFDGDGKADVACMRNYTSTTVDANMKHLLVFSKTDSSIKINSPRAEVVISDYIVQPLSVSNANLKCVLNQIVCNNTIGLNTNLVCNISTGMNLKYIDSIQISKPWIRPLQASESLTTSTLFKGSYNSISTLEGADTRESYININISSPLGSKTYTTEIENSIESSSAINVKDGECIKVFLSTKYTTNLTVFFNATAHFKGFINEKPLIGNDLLIFARTIIDAPESLITLNLVNKAEVIFPVTGQIYGNIVGETDTYTEEC